jgi:hypothetical protein
MSKLSAVVCFFPGPWRAVLTDCSEITKKTVHQLQWNSNRVIELKQWRPSYGIASFWLKSQTWINVVYASARSGRCWNSEALKSPDDKMLSEPRVSMKTFSMLFDAPFSRAARLANSRHCRAARFCQSLWIVMTVCGRSNRRCIDKIDSYDQSSCLHLIGIASNCQEPVPSMYYFRLILLA